MRRITAFVFTTLNGYYKGSNDDTSWHEHGEEGSAFSESQLERDDILLFGRKTYELMHGFWPTESALQLFPKIAQKMNSSEKWVLSKTLQEAAWNNTRILSDNAMDEIESWKDKPGKNITILGSGSVINQLTARNLIDTYQFLIDPLAIGKGTALFQDLSGKLELTLIRCTPFPKSGAILAEYQRRPK